MTEHSDDHIGVREKWPNHGKNLYPDKEEFGFDFKPVVEQYTREMIRLGKLITGGMALALGLEHFYFCKRLNEEQTTLGLISYLQHSWNPEED